MYRDKLHEVHTMEDLNNKAVIYTATCPFCNTRYASKDPNIAQSVVAKHAEMYHRLELIERIQKSNDVGQFLIDQLSSKCIPVHVNTIQADIWTDMPMVVCLDTQHDR